VLGGFDGFKWLNDLHILDVAKLEETEITSQVPLSCVVCVGHLKRIVVVLAATGRQCFAVRFPWPHQQSRHLS
jgi:hypothetical protein